MGAYLGISVVDTYTVKRTLATGSALITVLLILIGAFSILISLVLHAIKISIEKYNLKD
jgi:hypothetical protein